MLAANTYASDLLNAVLHDHMASKADRQLSANTLLVFAVFHGSCPAAVACRDSLLAANTNVYALNAIQNTRYLTGKVVSNNPAADNDFLFNELANIVAAGVQNSSDSKTRMHLLCFLQEVVVYQAFGELHTAASSATATPAAKAKSNEAYDALEKVLRYLDGYQYTSEELIADPITTCHLLDYTQPIVVLSDFSQKFVTKARANLYQKGKIK